MLSNGIPKKKTKKKKPTGEGRLQVRFSRMRIIWMEIGVNPLLPLGT